MVLGRFGEGHFGCMAWVSFHEGLMSTLAKPEAHPSFYAPVSLSAARPGASLLRARRRFERRRSSLNDPGTKRTPVRAKPRGVDESVLLLLILQKDEQEFADLGLELSKYGHQSEHLQVEGWG